MKLVISLVFSVFTFIISYGQDTVTYYYGDSSVSARGTMLNNKPHGLWKNFHENGNLKSIGKRIHGMLDSTWFFYYPDGKIKMRVQYRNGVKNGYTYKYKINPDSGHYLYKKQLYIDGKLHGKSITYGPDKEKIKVVKFEHGQREGYQISFNHKGKPKAIRLYRNNKAVHFQKVNQTQDSVKQGKWIDVDESLNIKESRNYQDGKIIIDSQKAAKSNQQYTISGLNLQPKDSLFEGQYIDGVPVGRHLKFDSASEPLSYIYYDSSGNKIREGAINNYQLQGTEKGYYKNGNLKYKGHYRKGQKHGQWNFYFKNGDLEQKGRYIRNLKHGKWIWFYKGGDTLRIEKYNKGEHDGVYISYDPYGNIIKKGTYYSNQKQNEWIENFGNVIFKGEYFDGQKNGTWKGHYLNGALFFEGEYIRGQKHDKHKYYYPDQQVRKIEIYKFGRPVGHWQFYKKDGSLYKVKSYNKGETLFYKP